MSTTAARSRRARSSGNRRRKDRGQRWFLIRCISSPDVSPKPCQMARSTSTVFVWNTERTGPHLRTATDGHCAVPEVSCQPQSTRLPTALAGAEKYVRSRSPDQKNPLRFTRPLPGSASFRNLLPIPVGALKRECAVRAFGIWRRVRSRHRPLCLCARLPEASHACGNHFNSTTIMSGHGCYQGCAGSPVGRDLAGLHVPVRAA